MESLDLIKQMLMDDATYWVVANKQEYHDKRHKDQIIFIALPRNIQIAKAYEEIMLKDIEVFNRLEITGSIHLNEPYAPFQYGVTFYNFYKGFPVKHRIKEFTKLAMNYGGDDYYEYEKIYKDLTKSETD